MISFLVNFLILLFTYLLVCLISFCLTLFASKGIGRFVRKFKFAPVKNSSLATIVYVTESIKKEDVSSLLEMLNKQEYDKSYYELHFILDGCNDETANMLEFIGGSKVYRMGSLGMPCGKEESISAVIERVLVSSNPDAFVFLNGNRKISEKFLSSVNVALAKNSVVVGMTQLEPKENCCAYHKILNCANLYSNRIINFGRSVLGLSCIIDFDICALKTTALEKVQCIECENESSELNYTFLLAQKKLAPVFNPCVISTI